MSTLAAAVATVVLGGVAVLQLLVARGRPLGRFVWGGQHRVLPRRLRIGSALSVGLYAGIAMLLWSRAGVLPGRDSPVVRVGTWVLVGYFALGVAVNAMSRSRPERRTMAPACVVLTAAAAVIALDVGAS